MTSICVVDKQGASRTFDTVSRRPQEGKRSRRQREKRKIKGVRLRVATLNIGTMTDKGRELTDMMQRRKDVL